MSWVVANIHRIMILSGLLTITMIYAALAPPPRRERRGQTDREPPDYL